MTVLVAALVAVHPVAGGIGGSEGEPAVGRIGTESLLDISSLAPGRAVEGSVLVANVGTAPGTFVLRASTGGSRLLAESLRLVVTDGARVLYEGSPAGLDSVPVGLLAPGEEQPLVLHAELPGGAGDELQGLTGTFDLTVTAAGA